MGSAPFSSAALTSAGGKKSIGNGRRGKTETHAANLDLIAVFQILRDGKPPAIEPGTIRAAQIAQAIMVSNEPNLGMVARCVMVVDYKLTGGRPANREEIVELDDSIRLSFLRHGGLGGGLGRDAALPTPASQYRAAVVPGPGHPIQFRPGRCPALCAGGLPLWSDRFGLGVPLLAESHAAALYPPNWALYRWLDVSTAW